MHRSHLSAAALSLALLASACGSDSAETTEAEMAETEMAESDGMDGMAMDMTDMDGMAMGDPSATRADEVDGAALATGELMLLDSRPEGFDDASGIAWLARHPGGTTVTVEMEGLLPDVEYISHLHADSCANDGGDHFQFEVGGSEMPPNEIHLAFTSDADGNGFMTAENHQIAGLDAVAFVVHPVELIDNKIACVDFVELEDGAAAAIIEQGGDHVINDSMDHDSMDSDESDMSEMDSDSMGEDSMSDDAGHSDGHDHSSSDATTEDAGSDF